MKFFWLDPLRQRDQTRIAWRDALTSAAMVCAFLFTVGASAIPYTEKQLDAFQERVGKVYWVDPSRGKPPAFLDAPAPGAATFTPTQTESFEITDLTRNVNDSYYKVRFESGKIGYVQPEAFIEQFNLSILSADPLADEKKRAEAESSEEKKRVAWINAQPWSPAVKQAAIKKQPTPGLTTAEVKRVLGPPRRMRKLRSPLQASEEQWFYPDGRVMIFYNGLLSRIDKAQN